MRQCMDADNLHRRLKKIIGQVQAIDRMVARNILIRLNVSLRRISWKKGYISSAMFLLMIYRLFIS